MVLTMSAASRYSGKDQSGQCGREGNGRMTGHQNSSAPPRKQACSILCQNGARSANSKAAGTCQPQRLTISASQPTTGCVRAQPNRRRGGQTRKGPTPSRAKVRGSPRSIGSKGAPSRISGGATDISRRGCPMCAESSSPEKVSNGDTSAARSANSPAKNAERRHAGKRSGATWCKTRQPRRYRTTARTTANEIPGRKDQEPSADCTAGDMPV